jgi:dephospho-CoA kinase
MDSGTLRLVVTGGIGAGKSTAARILADLGATVIDADRIGHQLLAGSSFEALARRWPSVVVDGRIDRSRLAEIVFSDESELRELEAITHPVIRGEIARRVAEAPGDRPVVVEISVPVPMVGGEWTTVVIDAPDDVRYSRLLDRGMDPGDIRARMAQQPSREDWQGLGDVVIDNSGSENDLRRKLRWLLRPSDSEDPPTG